jgi:hypothetical protein
MHILVAGANGIAFAFNRNKCHARSNLQEPSSVTVTDRCYVSVSVGSIASVAKRTRTVASNS